MNSPSAILVLVVLSVLATRSSAQETTSSLKDAAIGLFKIGVGMSAKSLSDERAVRLLKTEFDYATPENCMKPAAVQNENGLCDFRASDRFVKLMTENGIKVVGHCLVWAKDDRTPEWFYKSGSEQASREVLLDRMKSHMLMVMGRYRDKIDHWDVVNEVLESGTDMWRKSTWQEIFGKPDFLVEAFKIARSADPDSLLIYNDYRSELPGKRENLFKLIEYLQANGAPIDAIGLQGHYEFDQVPYEELEFTLNKIREYGLKVVISEVDIDVVKRGKWWAEGGKYREELKSFDPYADGCPPEVLEQQSQQYAKLFEVYCRHADIIERVTFWNLCDGESWLNYFPWERKNYPLLFDREFKRKPAHAAVVKVLKKYQAMQSQKK